MIKCKTINRTESISIDFFLTKKHLQKNKQQLISCQSQTRTFYPCGCGNRFSLGKYSTKYENSVNHVHNFSSIDNVFYCSLQLTTCVFVCLFVCAFASIYLVLWRRHRRRRCCCCCCIYFDVDRTVQYEMYPCMYTYLRHMLDDIAQNRPLFHG